jgi:hypothetical protein
VIKTTTTTHCDFCKVEIPETEKPWDYLYLMNPSPPGPKDPQPRFIKIKIDAGRDVDICH